MRVLQTGAKISNLCQYGGTNSVLGMLHEEYQRVRKFQKSFLGTGKAENPEQTFDSKIYTTHILTEGTTEEKRELLGSLKNKLILKDRKISLAKTNN
jgi:hypothetical protein